MTVNPTGSLDKRKDLSAMLITIHFGVLQFFHIQFYYTFNTIVNIGNRTFLARVEEPHFGCGYAHKNHVSLYVCMNGLDISLFRGAMAFPMDKIGQCSSRLSYTTSSHAINLLITLLLNLTTYFTSLKLVP